jgi:phospholipid/cholesterol/gamma-HCH transport system substrate-binding protein
MESNVNYTTVGIFVIALFAIIIISIVGLSAGFSVEQYTTYQVFMKESVDGLNIDAQVEFNGVTVGAVKSIEISQKDPQVVVLLLNVKNNTPITVGTKATLNMKGLTGMAYLALIDKGFDKKPLQVLPGQPYPVINTAPSLLVRFDTAMTKLNESIHEVSISIQTLLDTENLRSIKQILKNIQTATQEFSPLVQASRNTLQVITTQTLPAANQAMKNLDIITRNMVELSGEIKQNPAVLIRGRQALIVGPGES